MCWQLDCEFPIERPKESLQNKTKLGSLCSGREEAGNKNVDSAKAPGKVVWREGRAPFYKFPTDVFFLLYFIIALVFQNVHQTGRYRRL